MDGDQLVFGVGDDAVPIPVGRFEGDTWTIEAQGQKISKRRVGAATSKSSPIVGTWSYVHYTGGRAFERFDADGWHLLRVLMPGLSTGTFVRDGKALTMTIDGKAQTYDATLEGDRLRLVAKEDGKELEYRYAGATPWYDLAAGE